MSEAESVGGLSVQSEWNCINQYYFWLIVFFQISWCSSLWVLSYFQRLHLNFFGWVILQVPQISYDIMSFLLEDLPHFLWVECIFISGPNLFPELRPALGRFNLNTFLLIHCSHVLITFLSLATPLPPSPYHILFDSAKNYSYSTVLFCLSSWVSYSAPLKIIATDKSWRHWALRIFISYSLFSGTTHPKFRYLPLEGRPCVSIPCAWFCGAHNALHWSNHQYVWLSWKFTVGTLGVHAFSSLYSSYLVDQKASIAET